MTTLRLPAAGDLPEEDRAVLEAVARRLGAPLDQLSDIWRAQMHWPRYLEANHRQTLYGFRLAGTIPTLTKEAMHAAVSMANKCDF
jgi:alkylhydroperoxidase family enzyme